MRLVVAEGLPGIAELAAGNVDDAAAREGFFRLAGWVPGEGDVITITSGAGTSVTNAQAARQALELHAFEHDAFAVPFSFMTALEAAYEADVLQPWLDAHPAALLREVSYSRWTDSSRTLSGEPLGRWNITFSDATDTRSVDVHAALAPDGSRTTHVAQPHDGPTRGRLAAAPFRDAQVVASQELERILPRHIVEGGDLVGIRYQRWATDAGPEVRWTLSFSTGRGTEARVEDDQMSVVLDGIRGVLLRTQTSEFGSYDRTALPIALPDPPGESAATLSSYVAPGAGLAAGLTILTLVALLLKLLVVPLYTRLRRDRLLDNPRRASLLSHVRAHPGIHRAELAQRLGVREGVLRHHLQQLVRHRFLAQIHEGGLVRYYVNGEVPPEVARREGVLRSRAARDLYELYRTQPDLSLRTAAKRLGISAPSVHRTKKRLEREGLLPPPDAQS